MSAGPLRDGRRAAVRSAARTLYQQEATHRLLPMPLARQLVSRQAAAAWADPDDRRFAVLQMQYLLGESDRAGEAESLAPRYLFWSLLRAEYRWRPWLITRQRIDGLPLLQAARRKGRGIVLSTMHHGMRGGVAASFSNAGVPLHVIMAPELLNNPTPAQRQLARVVSRYAETFPAARGSYRHMVNLMHRGEVVSLSTDLPGSCPMTILGRRVQAASGAARLALETGAALVPVTTHQAGLLQTLRVHEPLDPADYTSVADLQQAIADHHEPALLAWPEAVEQPLRRWGPVGAADEQVYGPAAAGDLALMR